MGATSYTWDANGNLTNDGVRTYNYNTANRLTGVTLNGQTVNYRYNGLGDRLVEGETEFEMDLNTGLTQVLADSTNTYLYGNGRIGQFTGVDSAYFLGDALGSVRQLVNESETITLVRNYAPYGDVMGSKGYDETNYSFTGEWQTSNNLHYLRARFLQMSSGIFIQSDPSKMETNLYTYSRSNPVRYTDPSGYFSKEEIAFSFEETTFADLVSSFQNQKIWPFPHWGLVDALINAKPGDRMNVYYVEMGNPRVGLKKFDGFELGWSPEKGITLDNLPLKLPLYRTLPRQAFNPLWRGYDQKLLPSYYQMSGSTNRLYVDGYKNGSPYPDFRSITATDFGQFNKILSELCKFKGKIGVGISYGFMADRFGNKYWFLSGDVGVGVNYVSYMEGYQLANMNEHHLFRSTVSWDNEKLKSYLERFSSTSNVTILIPGAGITASGLIWEGFDQARAVSFSTGLGLSFSASPIVYTQYSSTDKELGWNWAIEHHMGKAGHIRPTFYEDIVSR